MFAIPGLLGMLLFIVVRPHDLSPTFAGLPVLNACAGLGLAGLVIDIRRLNARHFASPALPFIAMFYAWCLVTLVVNRPDLLVGALSRVMIIVCVYTLVAFGAQSFRKLAIVGGFFWATLMFVAVVVALQGMGERECFEEDPRSVGDSETLVPDGRPCIDHHECDIDGDPGHEYRCEKRGPFGTSSIVGRVRYVGILQDPNDTSLTIAFAVGLAFCYLSRRPNWRRKLMALATVLCVALAIYYAQSRGGQLVFIAVMGTYLYRRSGWRGLVLAVLLTAPLLFLGDRNAEEAESSSLERLECWYTGMQLFRERPLFGVGWGRFTDFHYLTAHNSFVLVIAETGFIGLYLFITILYLNVKVVLTALVSPPDGPQAPLVQIWAVALFASLSGTIVGIFFLSFAYHLVLWVILGVMSAFYGAVRAHSPEWRVEATRLDFVKIFGIVIVLATVLYLYTRYKVGG